MHVALHLSAIVLCAARRFSSARSQRAASVGVGALRQPPSARAPVSPKRAQSRAQSLSVDSAPGEIAVPGHLYIVHKGLALYGGKVLGAGKIWGEDVRRVVCEPARPLHPVTPRYNYYRSDATRPRPPGYVPPPCTILRIPPPAPWRYSARTTSPGPDHRRHVY